MGCLTFETAVENKSLAAFSLFVISGDSPLIAFTGVNRGHLQKPVFSQISLRV